MAVQKHTDPDWEDVRVFLAVARAGSLSGAARLMGVNHTTVARRLARLEADLGGRALTERGAEGHVLTEAGRAALAEAEAMEISAQSLARRVEAGETLVGPVRISAIASFVEHVLAPGLAPLARSHPDLELELSGEDRNVSLARGDADIALRHGRPVADQALTRKLGEVAYRLYGAPDYLAKTPAQERRLLGFSASVEQVAPGAARLTELAAGRPFAMRVASLGAQREAAAAGAGLALLPCYLAGRDSRLAPASTDAGPDWVQPLWMLLRADAARVARVRFVADRLVEIIEIRREALAGR